MCDEEMDVYRFPALTQNRKETYFDIKKHILDDIKSADLFDFHNVRVETISKDGTPFYSLFNKKQIAVIKELYLIQNLVPRSGGSWWHTPEPEGKEITEERERRKKEELLIEARFACLQYVAEQVIAISEASDSILVQSEKNASPIQ